MARIDSSPEILRDIRKKALKNAMDNGSYGTQAAFSNGRQVVSFAEICRRASVRRLF